MINGKKVLAIIPARAGSKRVKNKNLRDLGGKPLIAWTIEAAKNSKFIDHIYVSTDSSEIQKIGKDLSIDADPLREPELSGDLASSTDVVFDILKNKKTDFDIVILLQPTSPFRKTKDIDEALNSFDEGQVKSVVSMCETETPLSWCSELDESLKLDSLVAGLEQKRSQDIQKTYCLNGAIYITGTDEFLKSKTFYFKEGSKAFIMDRASSVDIDTEEDFSFAKALAIGLN